MKLRRFLCGTIVLITFLHSTALASVLGDTLLNTKTLDFADQTTYTTNTFMSNQEGVGKQTEFFVEYKPNKNVVPVITNGASVYGKRNFDQVMSGMIKEGFYPIMAMNADFFSFQTGVPMSHTIVDGEILTKSIDKQDAIGFNRDGTAFIAPLQIKTEIQVNDDEPFELENINKFRQPYVIYLLTEQFATHTQTADPGTHVIVDVVDGTLALGQALTGVVREVVHSEGSIPIPKGTIVLTLDDRAEELYHNQMALFHEGDTVTVTNTNVTGDARWDKVAYATGCFGGRLITKGKLTDQDEAAAPRSAIGIKADGTIVFYAIDGRQQGHSYGVRRVTLAKRLQELGCVDAVNLDGGGSTTIGGVYPGSTVPKLFNSPSEGSQRMVANFIALMDTAIVENPSAMLVQPSGGHYLSKATERFVLTGLEKGQALRAVYSIDGGGSTIAEDGTAVIRGDGEVTVTATYGGHFAHATVRSYQTPDEMIIKDAATGALLDRLTLNAGEHVSFLVQSKVGQIQLISDNGCYDWQIDPKREPIGTIDENGNFAASQYGAKGGIIVRAGEKEAYVDVTVNGPPRPQRTDISFERDGSTVFATLSTLLPERSISVLLDGAPYEFTLDGKRVTIHLPDRMMHKIAVYAAVGEEYPAVVFYTATGAAYPHVFTDAQTHWAKDYIAYLSHAGVVNGMEHSDGTMRFLPQDPMTRAQFAVMVANYIGIDGAQSVSLSGLYADAASIPDWAAQHVKVVTERGIIKGKSTADGKLLFDPNATVTRAEAITMLYRLLPNGLQQANITASDKASVPDWARQSFACMLYVGAVSGYEDGTLRPANLVTRAEAVRLLYNIY